MSTQQLPAAEFNPHELADTSYTLVVSPRQLYYIHRALREFVANDPGEDLDELGQDIPTALNEMLFEPMLPSPAINSFVL